MRRPARVALGIVIVMAASMTLPRGAGRIVVPDANAQIPTPTIPDVIGSPTPKPSPSESGGPLPGGGGGGGGGGGSGEPGGGGGGNGPGGGGGGGNGPGGGGNGGGRNGGGRNGGGGGGAIPPGTFRPTGPQGNYNTDELVAIAAHLRSLGWSDRDVVSRVFPPFIIAGPAAWTNTWGAPRYGPGPIIRTHEGQDVFCSYGDPILAPEDGTLSFGDGGLGGIVARVHRADGSYWYLAHLSDLNTEQFGTGDHVEQGDVIGFCGNTGNALTTPPHVHFGWYQGSGQAANPMRALVRWLREAERRARALVSETLGKRIRQKDRLTLARRFGDTMVPSVSELRNPSESLWASGASPATGAFGLAEVALQAALANQVASTVYDPDALEGANAVDGALDPDSALARLLRRRGSTPGGEISD